jgi:hypothetical protein
MCRELFSLVTFMWFLSSATLYASDAQKTPIPIWHATLDDMSSITVDGGQIINPPASFVPGAVDNAFAGNGVVYATWYDDEIETIFKNWDDNAGWTIDLYFLGDHWSIHSGDSGLWSVVRRYSDAFIIASVQDGRLRLLLRDASGEHTQHKYHLTSVPLIDNTAHRLTMRQYNGQFEVFLNGSSVFTADDLPAGYTCPFVAAGGGISREMNIGRRAIFGGTLQSGEWVDNVRVYNGFYTPAEIDAESRDALSDLDRDGMVSFQDLNILTSNWLFGDCNTEEGNLNSTGLVDFIDFSIMGNDWLTGTGITITQQPADLIVFEGETASFHILLAGPEPFTYKWQKDGLDLTDGGRISGTTTNTLEIKDVNTLDAGDYRCVVMNNYSTAISGKAILKVAEYGDIGISSNGHYVKYRGDTLLLIGDSGTQCVAQNSNLNHRMWIDDCSERGIRAIHLWSFVPVRQKQDGSQIEDRWGYVIPDVMPWARKTSGPLAHDQRYQWDLRIFDEGTDGYMTHYWPRMRDICSYAKSKNMLVGITMFTGWSKHDYSWVFHPLNINNGGHLTNKEEVVIIASPGIEVWKETWSNSWPSSKKTQWVWEQLSIKAINELGSIGNVFFVFFDEHSYSEGNMGDHFRDFFRKRNQIWMDWEAQRTSVNWVMSNTFGGDDKNSDPVLAFKRIPIRPYFFLEGEPYQGSGVRTAIWTFSMGGGNYFFHADAGQETVRTGIMGYDPYVPGGDKGMYKRNWLGHASRFFNEHVNFLDSMVPHNDLSSAGTYCLADPGREYVVYCTINSSLAFDLDLSTAEGKTVNCRFYDPRDGQFEQMFQRVDSSSSETFTKPTSDDWILHVFQE